MPRINHPHWSFSQLPISSSFSSGKLGLFSLLLWLTIFPSPSPAQSTIQFERYGPEQGIFLKKIHTIEEDAKGFLWMGGDEGLYRYDTKEFLEIPQGRNDPNGLHTKTILDIHLDKEGKLWLGTIDGARKLDPKTGAFTQYLEDSENPQSLSHNKVHALLEDSKGNFWLTTANMLNLMDRQKGTFTYFEASTDYHFLAMLEDRDQKLWLGAVNNDRVYRFDPETGIFETHLLPIENLSATGVITSYTMIEDRKGNIWVGNNFGLFRLGPDSDEFEVFTHDPANPESLGRGIVKAILEDRHGDIWVGTVNGGLSRLDQATGHFEHFRHDPEDPRSLSHNFVNSIFEDKQGNLWIGTFGGGLNRLVIESKKFIFSSWWMGHNYRC